MSSSLISRLNDLKSKTDVCSVEELHTVLEEALNLAEDAITEVISSDFVIEELLDSIEPAPDAHFCGDEGIK